MTNANRPLWVQALLLNVAVWMCVSVVLPAPAHANPQASSRSAVALAIPTSGKIIFTEKFSLVHLDQSSGFSFAAARYSGQIEITKLFPDAVVPPTAILSIKFPNVPAATTIALKINEAQGYDPEEAKLAYLENPFPAQAVFDFGTKNGIKAPANYDTGDPELLATLQFVKAKGKNVAGLNFKFKTYARAGGQFNIIQGYVPSVTAGANTGIFPIAHGSNPIEESVLVEFGVPGQNFLRATFPCAGGATLTSTAGKKDGPIDYKISAGMIGSVDVNGKPAVR